MVNMHKVVIIRKTKRHPAWQWGILQKQIDDTLNILNCIQAYPVEGF